MLEAAIEAGADNVESAPTGMKSRRPRTTFFAVRDALEARFGPPERRRLEWRPATSVTLDEERARAVLKLLDALDDSDDVQNVYANFESPTPSCRRCRREPGGERETLTHHLPQAREREKHGRRLAQRRVRARCCGRIGLTRMARLLGLDPGLRFTGWGLVEADGNRLRHLADGVIATDGDARRAGAAARAARRAGRAARRVSARRGGGRGDLRQPQRRRDAEARLRARRRAAGAGAGRHSGRRIRREGGQARGRRHRRRGQGTGAGDGAPAAARARIGRADAADALAVAICHAHHRASRTALGRRRRAMA